MTNKALTAVFFLLSLQTGAVLADANTSRKTLATIPSLDVTRYMGTWYELAKIPNDFQKKCVGDTTATYSLRDDGQVQVVNRCRTQDGGAEVAEGVARQIGEASSPKLKVRFAPAYLSFIPMVWGDYWVIDLDDNYQLAAVSEPKRRYLWILSRSPQVDPAAYDALLARLAVHGLDLSKLVRTNHAQEARPAPQ
jgi:apolipoprotein D and lipocalin family protein